MTEFASDAWLLLMKNSNSSGFGPLPEGSAASRAERAFLTLLEEGWGKPSGLTLEKASSRGYTIEESDEDPGKIVISVERHRAIAGCAHTKGLPMAAHQVYLQMFVFDPKSNQLTEGDEIDLGYRIDAESLAREQMFDCNLSVEIINPSSGVRRVSDCCFNWLFAAISLEEARSRMEDEVRSLNHECCFENLDLSDEVRAELVERLEDACVELILSRLEEAWRSEDRQ